MTDHAQAIASHSQSFLLVTILVLLTILSVFGMKFFSAGRHARLQAAGDNAYRELAGNAVASQSAAAGSLARLEADVADMKSRLAAIERVLSQVD